MKLIESGVPEQIFKQPFVRLAGGGECDVSIVHCDVGREEAVPVEAFFAVCVAPVGTDPEGAIADPGCPLQVRFEGLTMHFQEGIEIELLHRSARLIAAIDLQDIVFVISDYEEIRIDRNRARGIAHAGVARRPDQAEMIEGWGWIGGRAFAPSG
jgi:hypothetical protein